MRSGKGRRQIKNSPIRLEDRFAKYKPRQIFPLYGSIDSFARDCMSMSSYRKCLYGDQPSYHHYTNLTVIRVSVRPCVCPSTKYHRKLFDPHPKSHFLCIPDLRRYRRSRLAMVLPNR